MTWWRHQMETFSALLTICAENSPVTGEFSAHRSMTRSFDVFFDLRLNKRLSKQWWGWWFETPLCPLWRHCNKTQTTLHAAVGNTWISPITPNNQYDLLIDITEAYVILGSHLGLSYFPRLMLVLFSYHPVHTVYGWINLVRCTLWAALCCIENIITRADIQCKMSYPQDKRPLTFIYT